MQALEIKILACLEQNTRQYCSLDVATAKAVANEIDKQIQACISIEEADSFDIKVRAIVLCSACTQPRSKKVSQCSRCSLTGFPSASTCL